MTEKEICAICYESYETDKIKIVLGCNHSFHFNCLKKWKNEDKDSCPLCRGKMNIELTTQKEKKEEEEDEIEMEETERTNTGNLGWKRERLETIEVTLSQLLKIIEVEHKKARL